MQAWTRAIIPQPHRHVTTTCAFCCTDCVHSKWEKKRKAEAWPKPQREKHEAGGPVPAPPLYRGQLIRGGSGGVLPASHSGRTTAGGSIAWLQSASPSQGGQGRDAAPNSIENRHGFQAGHAEKENVSATPQGLL